MALHFWQRIFFEERFVASDCVSWGAGEPPTWIYVEAVLTKLKNEGLLVERDAKK